MKNATLVFAATLLLLAQVGLAGPRSALESLSAEDIATRTEQAYYFAYPMLQGYQALYGISIAEQSPSYFGPLNAVHSKPFTLNPSYTAVVSPNADTPYSIANIDLRREPVVFHVPAVRNRYYVMQLVDLYGYNAHYIGTRVTGSDAGSYLLAGPNWHGETPGGITDVLRFETDLVLGIGRTQLFGEGDLDALKAVVGQYRIEPLSAFTGSAPPPGAVLEWPAWNPVILEDERFIGLLNWLLTFCQPPNPNDREALASMASLGIGAGLPFDANALTAEQREAFREGIRTAQRRMADRARHLSPEVNGWRTLTGFGDRDYFKGDYFLKAAAATVGYLANDPEEASYPVLRVDSTGAQLNGAHRYRLTFAEPPPNNAFWSVTMYNTEKDGTGGFLVDNPLDRYLINDRTEGLVRDENGGLTISLQHEAPTDTAARANWLPAPDGDFYLIMRIYMPAETVLNGNWEPPAALRID